MKAQNKILKITLSLFLIFSLLNYQIAFAEETGGESPTGSSESSSQESSSPESSSSSSESSGTESSTSESSSESTSQSSESSNSASSESSNTGSSSTETSSTESFEQSNTEQSTSAENSETEPSETQSSESTNTDSSPTETNTSEESTITETSTEQTSNSVSDTQDSLVETSETIGSSSTSESVSSSESSETPQNEVRLTIRLNDSIVYSATTTISSDTVVVTDNTGATANIGQNTVLGMLTNADANSDAFAVTDLAFFASFNSYIINCISSGATPSCYNWQYTVNDAYPFVGIDDYVLNSGDDVYLYFGTQNRFSVTDTSISLGEPISVTAEKYEYRTNSWSTRANVTVGATQPNPADIWTPVVVTSTLTNTLGQASLYVTATGTYNIGIGEDYYYPTEAVTVTLPQTSINLNLQTTEGTLFKQNVTVTACPESPGSAIYTLNAWCALEQTAATNNWTLAGNWFGSDVYLDTINTYTTDFGAGKFWSWYNNLTLGETGLNKHVLSANENLLLTHGVNPIKLEVSSTTPSVGVTTIVTISELNFAAWPAEWVLLSSTTLHLNDTTIDLSSGTYEFIPTVTTTVFVSKIGYVPSDAITIIPGATASTNTNTTNSGTTGGGSSNTNENTAVSTFDINAAGNFLLTKQNSDGSIGSASLYSDWAAIAIGALGNSSAKSGLITYLKTDPTAGTTTTDYERRAMALLALGLNPHTDTKINYIALIMQKYDGTQFGDAGLVNDDIFALFPLLKSGYSTNDTEIQKAVAFILSKQNSAGGWESPDLTAAAVQALAQVKSLDGVNDALVRAKNYLKLSTKTDGRIGDNAFSTGWGLQALSALGESATTWNGTSTSPLNYLATEQQTDGGVNPTTDSNDNRIWATSYAIPGAQGKTWDSILISVPKFAVINSIGGNTLDNTATSTSSATTTTQTVTTTPQIATSTTQFATTTPEIIAPIVIENSIITESEIPLATESIPPSTNTETNPNAPQVTRTVQTVNANNETQSVEKTLNPPPKPTGEQLSTPTSQNPAEAQKKALFGGAAAFAGTAGAYLAWRFIQGLV